jgi:hypothetical protein
METVKGHRGPTLRTDPQSVRRNRSILSISFSVKNTEDMKVCVDLYGQTKHDGKVLGIMIGEFQCYSAI